MIDTCYRTQLSLPWAVLQTYAYQATQLSMPCAVVHYGVALWNNFPLLHPNRYPTTTGAWDHFAQGSTEANSLAMKHHAQLTEVEKSWQDKLDAARKVCQGFSGRALHAMIREGESSSSVALRTRPARWDPGSRMKSRVKCRQPDRWSDPDNHFAKRLAFSRRRNQFATRQTVY
jgi:hypothetical protein